MKKSISLTGIALLLAVSSLSAATHHVSLESTNPTPPYTNWVTAATNIQQAVNAAATGDEVVVTNGVYPGGVTVTNPLALLSVNGPQVTIINGGGTNRCASLTNGVSLSGFTLTNGYLHAGNGGGVWCASTLCLSMCSFGNPVGKRLECILVSMMSIQYDDLVYAVLSQGDAKVDYIVLQGLVFDAQIEKWGMLK